MRDYAFSKYIVVLREKHGLSRFDLARKLGIGYVTVAKWENAEALPTREELEKLSVFFGLSSAAIRAHSFTEGLNALTPTPAPKASLKNEIPAPEKETKAECEKSDPAPTEKIEESILPPVENISSENEEPIASTSTLPEINFNVIRNPQVEALSERKKVESRNEEIVSSYTRFGVKIRRSFAILTDTIVSALIALGLSCVAALVAAFLMFPHNVIVNVTTFAIYTGFVFAFALRDAIAGGTSLGKRVFGLYVVDKVNAARPVVWQRVVRSLGQIFVPLPDAIVVLGTGRGIGDLVAGTAVVSRKDFNNRLAEKNPLSSPVKVRKNRTCVTAILILLAASMLVAIAVGVSYFTTLMLNDEKQSEEYLYAYDAVIESEEFNATDAEVSELMLVTFNRRTTLGENGMVTVVDYTFETNEYYIYVTVESSIDGISVTDITVESVFALE